MEPTEDELRLYALWQAEDARPLVEALQHAEDDEREARQRLVEAQQERAQALADAQKLF